MTQNITINLSEVFEVLKNSNFSSEKQIELLEILSCVLYEQEHPDDPSGIIDHRIQILKQSNDTPHPAEPTVAERSRSAEASRDNAPCVKVKSVAILELLKKMNAGTAHNDMSKISKLIAFLTGNSYNHIYNEMRKGISLTNYHTKDINEINQIFTELNLPITIQPDTEY